MPRPAAAVIIVAAALGACGGGDGAADSRDALTETQPEVTPDDADADASDTAPTSDLADTSDTSEGADTTADDTTPAPLHERYLLPGRQLYPESLAFDPARRAFFVSSLDEGSVLRVAADGEVTRFFEGSGEPDRVTLGVKVDSAHDRLAVCSYLDVAVPTGRVWLFDLVTGVRTHDIDLTTAAPDGSCNDLVFDADGALYVTDRELPNVYRIDAITADGGARASLFASDPLLDKLLVGQNGIAFTPDHQALMTVHYLPPQLFRVAVAAPHLVQKVELDGTHPLSQLLSGADGMLFHGDTLYVAFGSALIGMTASSPDWTSASYVALDAGTKMPALTVAEGEIYALASDVALFVIGGAPAADFEIFRLDSASLRPLDD